MKLKQLNILLADDDKDDCLFFKDALGELLPSTNFTAVHDGEQLMQLLSDQTNKLPDVLFLDLSMPRKNGYECLTEIKENIKLKGIPIIMFSTSYSRDKNYEREMINTLNKIGAQDYIRKPGGFEQLKQAIHRSLTKVIKKKFA